MKEFKIVHASSKRIRVYCPYYLTLSLENYFKDSFASLDNFLYFESYRDHHHFALTFSEPYQIKEIIGILRHFKSSDIHEKSRDFSLVRDKEPYDIISDLTWKKILRTVFLPKSIRLLILYTQTFNFGKAALKALSQKKLTMDVLDFTAIMVSIFSGDTKTASTIMFLLGLGEELDQWSQKKSISDLEHQLLSKVQDVWIIKEDKKIQISSDAIQKGDYIIVSAGSEVLFDSRIVKGRGNVNESAITGELFAIEKNVGDTLYSGSLVEQGEFVAEVEDDNQNARIKELVDLIKLSESKVKSNQGVLLQKADDIVKFNFLGTIITYVLTGSFVKALSFLLVDYSCALKLSTPIVNLTAVKEAANRGVIVKGSHFLESYHKIDTFIFDKTGTLTDSLPTVEKIIPFGEYTENDVLLIGACLEEHYYHPLAQSLVKKAEERHLIHDEMHGDVQHVSSKGIRSSIHNSKIVIGSLSFIQDEAVVISEQQQQLIEQYGETYNLLLMGYKKELIAIFCIDTPIRPETVHVLEVLKSMGKKLVLLTGDTAKRTEKIKNLLDFDDIRTQVKPIDKYNYVKSEQEQGRSVLMIGDGLNDSAAISLADIGVVMGESSDAARQTSDIILSQNRLDSILDLFEINQILVKKQETNLTTTLVVNSSLILAGLFNILPPSILAVLHNGTTLVIISRSFSFHS